LSKRNSKDPQNYLKKYKNEFKMFKDLNFKMQLKNKRKNY